MNDPGDAAGTDGEGYSMDQHVIQSTQKRDKQESLDFTRAFLFGAAVSTPFWLTVAAALAAVAAWK